MNVAPELEARRDPVESDKSAVSWSAIFAGAAASLALTFVLLALGTGLGFAVVSPWPNAGMSASTFSIAAGLFLIVVAMLASSIGGYVTGRLRTRWSGAPSDEVYFRDTAHGLLAWAVATVLGASALGGLAGHVATGASVAMVGGASALAGDTAAFERRLDQLLRADPATATRADARPATDANEVRGELGRLMASAFVRRDELSNPDRSYAAQIVAARTGMSVGDAERRVVEVVNEARSAADRARRSTRNLALWLTASMLVGAFAAGLAATEGGGLRDGTWRGLRRRPA
ncbi:MAG: hypothetical protein JNK67_15725 [Alphaproteobacteria bacterium]|nr:hypothetical protein [Alphaproteobacteria bacterium]